MTPQAYAEKVAESLLSNQNRQPGRGIGRLFGASGSGTQNVMSAANETPSLLPGAGLAAKRPAIERPKDLDTNAKLLEGMGRVNYGWNVARGFAHRLTGTENMLPMSAPVSPAAKALNTKIVGGIPGAMPEAIADAQITGEVAGRDVGQSVVNAADGLLGKYNPFGPKPTGKGSPVAGPIRRP